MQHSMKVVAGTHTVSTPAEVVTLVEAAGVVMVEGNWHFPIEGRVTHEVASRLSAKSKGKK